MLLATAGALGGAGGCARAPWPPDSPPLPAPPVEGAAARDVVPHAAATDTGSTCDRDELSDAVGDSTESRLLRGTAGRVVRDGCRLTFRDATGVAELMLDDVLHEGERWIVHRYQGHIPALRADLVERARYEGGAYLLVFAGGALIDVAGPPLLSPDEARFATSHIDLVAGYDPNVLQIWRRTPAAARLELALTSDEWGPSDVRWTNDTTLTFLQNFPSHNIDRPTQRTATVAWRAGRWRVELHAR